MVNKWNDAFTHLGLTLALFATFKTAEGGTSLFWATGIGAILFCVMTIVEVVGVLLKKQ